MPKDEFRFGLKFGSQTNDIEAKTYGEFLSNFAILIDETNQELETGAHVDLRVKAEGNGSFLSELGIEPSSLVVLAPLIQGQNLIAFKDAGVLIFKTIKGVLEFRKWLGNEKPESYDVKGESVVVNKGNNNQTVVHNHVFNITVNNDRSKEAVGKMYAAVERDEKIDNVELVDENGESVFEAERDEFEPMAQKIDLDGNVEKTETDYVHLTIVRQSFDRAKKSDFIYKNFPITAWIKDDGFWERVDRRQENFEKGDQLYVELEITQKFDKAINTFVNKVFVIREVIQHIKMPEQPSLLN